MLFFLWQDIFSNGLLLDLQQAVHAGIRATTAMDSSLTAHCIRQSFLYYILNCSSGDLALPPRIICTIVSADTLPSG